MDPVERAGSGLKLIGFARAGSIESGEKTNDMHLLPNEHGNHPSLSCNANIFSACEASKEVTQVVKQLPTDECGYPRPEYIAASTGIYIELLNFKCLAQCHAECNFYFGLKLTSNLASHVTGLLHMY